MGIIKYVAKSAPRTNLAKYTIEELRQVELSIASIVALLIALNVPVEVGAADSGGSGYRMLRIPN